jgi:hypothetical protein
MAVYVCTRIVTQKQLSLSQKLTFGSATKRSHVVAVTVTIKPKLQTLFTKSCIRSAPTSGIIYGIFKETKNSLNKYTLLQTIWN